MAMWQDFPRGRAARVMQRPGTRPPAAVRTVCSPFGEQAGAFMTVTVLSNSSASSSFVVIGDGEDRRGEPEPGGMMTAPPSRHDAQSDVQRLEVFAWRCSIEQAAAGHDQWLRRVALRARRTRRPNPAPTTHGNSPCWRRTALQSKPKNADLTRDRWTTYIRRSKARQQGCPGRPLSNVRRRHVEKMKKPSWQRGLKGP